MKSEKREKRKEKNNLIRKSIDFHVLPKKNTPPFLLITTRKNIQNYAKCKQTSKNDCKQQ